MGARWSRVWVTGGGVCAVGYTEGIVWDIRYVLECVCRVCEGTRAHVVRVDAHARGRGGARATRREVRRRRRGRTRRGRRRGGCGCGWMDGFVFVRSRAVMRRMDARARECVNARASAMDDRRREARIRIRSSTVVRARGRRGGDATTNGRRKIIYIYICAFSSRAREGETRRGIEETRD